MSYRRLGSVALLAIIVALIVGIGSSVQAQDSGKQASYTLYIGQITDEPDTFIGIAISEGKAMSYVCDGQADKGTVTIAEWFSGAVESNGLDLTNAAGNAIAAKIGDTADGEITLKSGAVKKFSLALADENAGFYRSEFAVGSVKYVGGWLLLSDGSARGAVKSSSTDGETTTPSYINAYNFRK